MPLYLFTPAETELAPSEHMERDLSGGKKTKFVDKEVGFIHVVFHLPVSTGSGVK